MKGSGSCGRDEFADFELKLMQAPHLTDGFRAFYCLYLQNISHCLQKGITTLELIDFMCGIPYYVHLEEKSSNSYKYYIEEEGDFLLLSIAGLEKQIYIGMDIPIGHGNLSYTLQPMVADIVEDIQFLIEDC